MQLHPRNHETGATLLFWSYHKNGGQNQLSQPVFDQVIWSNAGRVYLI